MINSVIGYGTFITHGHWKNKVNVEICIVNNFIRIYPPGNWYPYVLPSKNSSFWALKFDVNEQELKELDYYEGVSAKLFKRIEAEISLKNNRTLTAFIYVPTDDTIKSLKLTPELDKNDKWKEEIKKFPEIVKRFPELVL